MSIQDKLYEKLLKEYQLFIGELKLQSVDSIIDRAAEKTFKQDILFFFEENDIDPPDAEVLLALDNTLDAVYQALSDFEISYMDRLGECIEDKAAELIGSQTEQALSTAKITDEPQVAHKPLVTTQPKPTLEEKLKAANEKVKKQDNNNKSPKHRERD